METRVSRLYRQDIRVFATDSSVSSATSWSNVRVDRTLALFIETGGLYVVFFVRLLSIYRGVICLPFLPVHLRPVSIRHI